VSALTQWLIVGLIVVLSAAYAVKVLLPRAARLRLAGWLRARGRADLAAPFEAGTGCDACTQGTRPTAGPAAIRGRDNADQGSPRRPPG
jgi:hypothetical protein